MILTGKSKNDFEKWYWNDWLLDSDRSFLNNDLNDAINHLWKSNELFLNRLITDWLDSVGIYISIESVFDNMLGYHRGFQVQIYQDGKQPISIDKDNDVFESRQQATESAIKEANEIYNSRK